MLPPKITKQIQVIASPGSELRSGDYLLVQVLKRLIGDKWAIGYKGKVFSAVSDVELKPGEKILTQVIRSGKKLVLQIKDSPNETPYGAGARHDSPLMAASSLLIKSLLRAGISPRPEILAKIGKIYQNLKRNNQGRESRIAGAIARLLDKQIDPSSNGFTSIVKILSLLSEDENNGGRKDRWSEKEEDLREWIKRIVDTTSADNEEKGNPLQVFNHLKALNESWVVIPYRFSTRGVTYQGLIKLLLDTHQRNVKCMILDVRQKEEIWSFLLRREKTKMKLVLCSNNAVIRKSVRKKISSLLSKLQNHGVEIDDSIYDEGEFDGFSFPEEGVGYPSVNTYS